jgi:ribosomal protein L40E
VPLIAQWIEQHPRKADHYAPLWLSLAHNGKGQLEYHSVVKIIKDAARGVGVQKRVYCHLFRHSSATRDAHFLNEAELRIKYGWEKGSDMPATYVHLAAKDIDEKLISVYSKKILEVKPEFIPLVCGRCNEKNTPGTRFCGRCGTPLRVEELVKSSVNEGLLLRKLEEMELKLEKALNKKAVVS